MFLVRQPMFRRFIRVVIAVAGALLLVCGSAMAAPKTRPLTSAERTRLSLGQLVTRPTIERRGSLRLVGGSSWQVVHAKPSVVWQAVLDTPRFHRMLPRVRHAKLVAKTAQQRTVFIRHDGGVVDVDYYLTVKTYPERWDITFALDESRPHEVRAAWGFYSIRPYGKDKTLVAFGAMVDVGDGLIASLARSTVQEWTLKVPAMVKSFVEGPGRRLYR